MNAIQTERHRLQALLKDVNTSNGFQLTVLADRQGLPLAWAHQGAASPERYSAAVALLNRTIGQIRAQLDWPEIDEMAIADERGNTLICRTLTVKQQVMSLVVVADKYQSYRRAMNQTLQAIESLLSQPAA